MATVESGAAQSCLPLPSVGRWPCRGAAAGNLRCTSLIRRTSPGRWQRAAGTADDQLGAHDGCAIDINAADSCQGPTLTRRGDEGPTEIDRPEFRQRLAAQAHGCMLCVVQARAAAPPPERRLPIKTQVGSRDVTCPGGGGDQKRTQERPSSHQMNRAERAATVAGLKIIPKREAGYKSRGEKTPPTPCPQPELERGVGVRRAPVPNRMCGERGVGSASARSQAGELERGGGVRRRRVPTGEVEREKLRDGTRSSRGPTRTGVSAALALLAERESRSRAVIGHGAQSAEGGV